MRDVSGVSAVTELAGRDGGATQAPVAEGLRIHLLGGFRVSTGQVPAVSWRLRTAAALVKLLALAPGHRLHREQVLEWLWPEAEPAAAANRFYHALYAARRALQPGLARGRESPYLHLQGDLLTLSPQVAPWIDLEAFQAAAASARRLRDATRYWEAIDGFSADLLPEDRYEDWCRPAAEAHRATYLALLAEVAELHEARGEHTLATDALRRLLLYDPAHEGAHRGLMRLYASCGRRQEALRQFAQLEEALRRELDAQPDAATRSLYEAICSGDFPPSSPASPVHSFVSGGIPAAQQAAAHAAARGPAGGGDAAGFSQLTSFVGRARERSEAARLLATARLVTLTGPGGVGKTRLALQLAAEAGEIGVEPAPPAPAARSDSASGPPPRASRLGSDGVYLVSLAPVRDPALVVATIARTLGLADHAAPAVGVIPHAEDGLARRPAAGGAEGGDVPPTPAPHPLLGRLKEYLGQRRILLVLDNFEHVLDAAPQVAELLASCPHLRVLVTSRAALNLSGEHRFEVPPLALPEPTVTQDPQRLAASDAVSLFIERARAAGASLALTAETAGLMAQICRRLDGLPLAIELAAARVQHLSLRDLATRLDRSLPLLVGGPRDLPARQQTLRDTIAWSYNLLSQEEQVLFRRLGVFARGCTLEAAEAIGGTGNVLEHLAGLVSKSLLRSDGGQADQEGAGSRYMMLETIHEFALEELAAHGEVERTRRRHASYFLRLAERARRELSGPGQIAWLERLERDHDNLRVALQWSIDCGGTLGALRFAMAMSPLWWRRWHLTEGRRWLAQVLALPEPPGKAGRSRVYAARRAQALALAALLARLQGASAAARPLYEAALALRRQLGEPVGIARALADLARTSSLLRDEARTRALRREAEAILRAQPDRRALAWGLCTLGDGALNVHDYPIARAYYAEGLAILRQLDVGDEIADALHAFGVTYWREGDVAAARPVYEELLAINRRRGDPLKLADTLQGMGAVALGEGNLEAAAAHFTESLAIYERLGDNNGIANIAASMGYIAYRRGDYAAARPWLTQALLTWRAMDHTLGMAGAVQSIAALDLAEGQAARAVRLLSAAAVAIEAVGTASLSRLQQDLPQQSLREAEAQLGPRAYAAAVAAGRAMSLEQALAEALGPPPATG